MIKFVMVPARLWWEPYEPMTHKSFDRFRLHRECTIRDIVEIGTQDDTVPTPPPASLVREHCGHGRYDGLFAISARPVRLWRRRTSAICYLPDFLTS
jgi:hypothetical protein